MRWNKMRGKGGEGIRGVRRERRERVTSKEGN